MKFVWKQVPQVCSYLRPCLHLFAPSPPDLKRLVHCTAKGYCMWGVLYRLKWNPSWAAILCRKSLESDVTTLDWFLLFRAEEDRQGFLRAQSSLSLHCNVLPFRNFAQVKPYDLDDVLYATVAMFSNILLCWYGCITLLGMHICPSWRDGHGSSCSDCCAQTCKGLQKKQAKTAGRSSRMQIWWCSKLAAAFA